MTVHRFRDRLKFYLERWLQRGAPAQLAFIAAVIVLIAVLGGLVAWAFSGAFEHVGHAIWWAFLRLTDPGYLGDDEGALLRTISTVITVLGYVVFLGSLVAILTQWLNGVMSRLESGLTPIAIRDHVLILGWTNRTSTIIQELLLSEGRVRRFLRRRGARALRIVVLAEHVDAALSQELRDTLGSRGAEHQIILRSGTSLRLEHLRRVAYRHAAVIIIPGADFFLGGARSTDARVIKTLVSLSNSERGTGASVVAEIFDTQKLAVAESAYLSGEIDVIASDGFISRLIAQNVRHRGLSFVYSELLSHARGNEVYVRRIPEWAGQRFEDVSKRFPEAILAGVARPVDIGFESYLNPPSGMTLMDDDRLIFIARRFEDCFRTEAPAQTEAHRASSPAPRSTAHPARRVLILGWSHKVRSLVEEFAGYESERFEIDVLSRIRTEERNTPSEFPVAATERIEVRHLQGDYTYRDTLAAVDPMTYDNVVFLASDWMDTEEESDARTILGYVLLRSILKEKEQRPEVLVELMDPENARLFRRRAGEVIISPMILSHILAHVALRRELSTAFSELFGPGGTEFYFRSAADYELPGRHVGMPAIQSAARARQEIALGVRIAAEMDRLGGGVYLNPPSEQQWALTADDEIIVLASS